MYATRTKDTEQSARLRENYKIVLRKLWKREIWKRYYFYESLMKLGYVGTIY